MADRGALRYVRGQGIIPANRPLSPATLNRHLVALGSVLTYARKRRLLPRGHVSAIKGVDKQRESEGRLIYLTEQQVERVIACAGVSRWRRLPALVRMAFTTGLRLGALKGLRWRDVDLQAGRAIVERTKNGRPHVAHLTPATVSALKAMPGHRLPDGLVFSGRGRAACPRLPQGLGGRVSRGRRGKHAVSCTEALLRLAFGCPGSFVGALGRHPWASQSAHGGSLCAPMNRSAIARN